ncbi:MAG: hypothetical protein Q8S44_04530 [Flavobacteriaceae bacterium]|nr:hypothetical protein [Flavobacteriaceae bacterium]
MKTTKLDSFDQRNQKKHIEDLGLQLPEDYFSKSKANILSQVSSKKRGKLMIFSRKTIVWSTTVAALLIFTITLFKHNESSSTDTITNMVSDTVNAFQNENITNNNFVVSAEDVLLASLFVEESHVNEYVDNYIKEEIINHVTGSE